MRFFAMRVLLLIFKGVFAIRALYRDFLDFAVTNGIYSLPSPQLFGVYGNE
jgi:hypothetical protein